MSTKQKRALVRILVSFALFIMAYLLPLEGWARFAAFLLPYLFIGWHVLYSAARNIANGQVFDENFLMALATIGAFAIGEYPEAVAVMLFYQIGELFESYAVGKSRKSIASLMDIRPDYANIELDGQLTQVDPQDVSIGSVIVVKPGEKIPLDGVVIEGNSSLNMVALTGESLPREVTPNSDVISGSVNQTGVLRIRVTKSYEDSTVSKILEMVENASEKKAPVENFITKFARYYTPCVVIGAALLAVLPPLFVGGWTNWIQRALVFLVVSCPCALVISIPLSFFGGIGGASQAGVLIKGGNYLEALAQTKTIVFDKTGTLTKGSFVVTAVHPEKISEAELLEYAALAESYSNHPISRSIKAAYKQSIDTKRVSDVKELPGHGVSATVDGKSVRVGNERLMEQGQAEWHDCHLVGTIVHVSVGNEYAGHIVISDEIKPDSAQAVRELAQLGVERVAMLTGDSRDVAQAVADDIGIQELYAELLPAQKVEQVEQLIHNSQGKGRLTFVGDGINDAPVLTRADVGIAMGALGSDAAIEAADIVLMDDRPMSIVTAVNISRKTMRIVKQNILFALGVKLIVLVLGALGLANMWAAVFADVGVSVIAILNAMRALKLSQK